MTFDSVHRCCAVVCMHVRTAVLNAACLRGSLALSRPLTCTRDGVYVRLLLHTALSECIDHNVLQCRDMTTRRLRAPLTWRRVSHYYPNATCPPSCTATRLGRCHRCWRARRDKARRDETRSRRVCRLADVPCLLSGVSAMFRNADMAPRIRAHLESLLVKYRRREVRLPLTCVDMCAAGHA